MAENQTFLKLIKDCKQSKRMAQKELYRQYYAYALTVCLHYAKDRNEAKDILNEGFFKVFTNLNQFKTSQPFKPWIRRIMVNTAIDYFRKYYKNTTTHLKIDHLQIQDVEITGFDKLAFDDVLDLVQQLSPIYRSVFNLFVLEGFSHNEIGEKLGISAGTSKSNLSRAKVRLREMLFRQEKKYNNG